MRRVHAVAVQASTRANGTFQAPDSQRRWTCSASAMLRSWTIDLFYILRACGGLRVHFSTVNLNHFTFQLLYASLCASHLLMKVQKRVGICVLYMTPISLVPVGVACVVCAPLLLLAPMARGEVWRGHHWQ